MYLYIWLYRGFVEIDPPIKAKLVRFKCPLCSKTFPNLWSLKTHFKNAHGNLTRCPFCGWEGKVLTSHAYYMVERDEDHAILYYLLSSPQPEDKEVLKKAKKIAYERLKYEP